MAKDVEGKGEPPKDVEGKGDDGKDVEGKGGPDDRADLVNDIVNRASALGGWLIVSIVSPLPSNGKRFTRPAATTRPSDAVKQAADEVGKLIPPGARATEPAMQPDHKTNQGTPK